MNEDARKYLEQILSQDPATLTPEQVGFLNARRDSLTSEQRRVFASVLTPEAFPKKNEEVLETIEPRQPDTLEQPINPQAPEEPVNPQQPEVPSQPIQADDRETTQYEDATAATTTDEKLNDNPYEVVDHSADPDYTG